MNVDPHSHLFITDQQTLAAAARRQREQPTPRPGLRVGRVVRRLAGPRRRPARTPIAMETTPTACAPAILGE